MSIDHYDYDLVAVGELEQHPANPRKGNVEVIAESIRENGFYKPIVVQRSTKRILAGNHSYLAAKQEGMTSVPVIWADVDDIKALRILAVDNRANDLAGYEQPDVIKMLQTLKEEEALIGSGYTEADLNELLNSLESPAPVSFSDPDDVPDVPVQTTTTLGDIWVLGDHRLVCGDSSDAALLDRLLTGGQEIDLVWTDPPYGVSYQTNLSKEDAEILNRRKDGLEVQNDGLTGSGLTELLTRVFNLAQARCRRGASWYVAAPSGPEFLIFGQVLQEMGIWHETLIWAKDVFAFGRSDYHYRHESIFYGWVPTGPHYFIDDRTQDTVWEIPRPKRSPEHPTMKPVELIRRAIVNSSKPGQVIFDPFGGSGSTLIATHDANRVARLIEIDPRYCDVICRRFQEHTGIIPVNEVTGNAMDFTGPSDTLN